MSASESAPRKRVTKTIQQVRPDGSVAVLAYQTVDGDEAQALADLQLATRRLDAAEDDLFLREPHRFRYPFPETRETFAVTPNVLARRERIAQNRRRRSLRSSAGSGSIDETDLEDWELDLLSRYAQDAKEEAVGHFHTEVGRAAGSPRTDSESHNPPADDSGNGNGVRSLHVAAPARDHDVDGARDAADLNPADQDPKLLERGLNGGRRRRRKRRRSDLSSDVDANDRSSGDCTASFSYAPVSTSDPRTVGPLDLVPSRKRGRWRRKRRQGNGPVAIAPPTATSVARTLESLQRRRKRRKRTAGDGDAVSPFQPP